MIRFLFLLTLALSAAGAEMAGEFDAANRLYEKGDFAGAIASYQRLASNRVSPALLFNLGNAYFKNGQIGKAIVSYRRAEELEPRDPDIRANLRFAREGVPGNTARVTAVDRVLGMLSLGEIGTVATLGFWGLFSLLAVAQWRPEMKPALRGWIVVAGALTVVSSAWLAQALTERANHRVAVVTVASSAVRFGPLEESQISFNVRDGNELRVVGQKDAWLQVVDPSNRAGWILTNEVTQLR